MKLVAVYSRIVRRPSTRANAQHPGRTAMVDEDVFAREAESFELRGRPATPATAEALTAEVPRHGFPWLWDLEAGVFTHDGRILDAAVCRLDLRFEAVAS